MTDADRLLPFSIENERFYIDSDEHCFWRVINVRFPPESGH